MAKNGWFIFMNAADSSNFCFCHDYDFAPFSFDLFIYVHGIFFSSFIFFCFEEWLRKRVTEDTYINPSTQNNIINLQKLIFLFKMDIYYSFNYFFLAPPWPNSHTCSCCCYCSSSFSSFLLVSITESSYSRCLVLFCFSLCEQRITKHSTAGYWYRHWYLLLASVGCIDNRRK